MKHKIPRLAAHFPAFWPILTVYLLEFGVLGPGQCYLILRQLSMWVPAVLGMMLMRLSGSYNMAVGTQMTFSAALLGILLHGTPFRCGRPVSWCWLWPWYWGFFIQCCRIGCRFRCFICRSVFICCWTA